MKGSSIYCPVTASWIGRTQEQEIAGNRTLYDRDTVEALAVDPRAQDFNEATEAGGWHLPDELLEAVTACQFCEAYCRGTDDGPPAIPPLTTIDRKALLQELYPGGLGEDD